MARQVLGLAARRLLFLLATAVTTTVASPYPRNDVQDAGFAYLLLRRDCASHCGADNQFCCAANEVCTTVMPGNVATCVAGSWAPVITTWTETRTYTSTIMTHWIPAPVPTPGIDCKPQSPEQEACGPICCAGWQMCAYRGQCAPRPGYQEPSTVIVTSDGHVTTRYSAPFRVTGVTTIVNSGVPTVTGSSPTSTTTSDGDTIGAGDKQGTGGGLSGGAIAGIVIGTLAGLLLLLLLCFCCIARGIWAALCGRGRRGKRSEKGIVEEEIYSSRPGTRVSSAHARRDRHAGWFPGGGGRPTSAGARRNKNSDGKWWLGLAGAATGLLALLSFNKDKKKPPPKSRRATSSHYNNSDFDYTDSYITSSSGSGRRTHRTGRKYRSASRVGSYHSRAPSRRP